MLIFSQDLRPRPRTPLPFSWFPHLNLAQLFSLAFQVHSLQAVPQINYDGVHYLLFLVCCPTNFVSRNEFLKFLLSFSQSCCE